MFVKSRKYYFNRQVLDTEEQEDMWTIIARPRGTHLGTAPYPDELVKRCLDIGCPPEGSVLDPFAGGGTTLRVAVESGRSATGIDLNPEFCQYIVPRVFEFFYLTAFCALNHLKQDITRTHANNLSWSPSDISSAMSSFLGLRYLFT